MLHNFSWIAFLIGVAFAMFIWPMVAGVLASARSRVSKATG